jgi:hypothetical protein
MPRSLAVSIRPSVSCRVSKAEYSAWTASILATVSILATEALRDARFVQALLEFALRSVAAEHSERPMYFVFPALRIRSSAGIDSLRGVSRVLSGVAEPDSHRFVHTRVDAVEIIQIRGESESFDGAVNVCFDMRG